MAFICLVVSLSNAANVIYVDVNSPNDPGTGASEDPFRRIQAGIDAAANGDTVQIQQGIYTGAGNYDLDPLGKAIIIRSSDPNSPGIIAQTIIDPNHAGRGFYIHSEEDANCVISGLTIRNSQIATGDNGAGIDCYDSSPTIRNCVIQNGHAVEGSGGGICFDYGSATVINCTITGNIADYYGGGIECNFSSPMIIGCTISGNTAILEGGGIDSGASEPNIFNCIIIDNNSLLGGGINCYYPGVANVVNCTIVANSADNAGGAIHCWAQSSAIIENSIIWANSSPDGTQLGLEYEGTASVTYCDVQGGQADIYDPDGLLVWGGGNIDIDPCFASFDPNGDPNLWDLHLQSKDGRWDPVSWPAVDLTQNGFVDLQDFAAFAALWCQQGEDLTADFDDSNTVDLLDLKIMLDAYLAVQSRGIWVYDDVSSPCVDAGDPNSDWSSEPWPNGKRINIGAYGETGQASKSGNIADLNIDGKVNFIDLAELGKLWGANQETIEDLDNSGTVDIGDLDILADNWLWEK
jgi:hypothetical protein